jgi:LPXTG-motif cell wall-anchored protein
MHTNRRTYEVFIAVLGMIAALMILAAPASAAPYTPGASLFVSDSNPPEGSPLTVFGRGFGPNEPVSIDLESTVTHLTTVTTDPNGVFFTTVRLPDGAIGEHRIVGTGQDSGRTASARIFIGDPSHGRHGGFGGGGFGGGGFGGGGFGDGAEGFHHGDHGNWNDGDSGGGSVGNLPNTGASGLVGIGVLGIALLGGGILMAAKRRKI